MKLEDITDEMADAANIALHEFMWGPEEPLTRRDLGIIRQSMKVAIAAAFAQKDACVCTIGVQECSEHPGQLRTKEEKIAFRKEWDARVGEENNAG